MSRMQKSLLGLAVLIIAATWLTLVISQPTDSNWESLADSRSSTIALVGFLVPAILALIAVVPQLPVRTLSLIPVALALNIITGQVIGTMGLPLPLYMDSIGTVLVGALAGPWAGLVTGVLSSLVWGTFNPTVVPFAAAYAFVGVAAGLLRKLFVGAWWASSSASSRPCSPRRWPPSSSAAPRAPERVCWSLPTAASVSTS